MDKESAEKLIRKVLPNFNITGVVGKGSFGSVYKIEDNLKERVAKIVPLHAAAGVEKGAVVSAGSKLQRDFRHIVESYERIACDEIVTVYDFYMESLQEEEGSAYAIVIMEIYPSNLQDYVVGHFEKTGRAMDIAVAEKLMQKVASMMNGLYVKMGFLFEDFKPDNILVKEHLGDLKLVVGDIGGLKNVVSIALTGSQITPTYCAPEVIRKAQVPDLLSVIYSYGLLCFFILEGHLPYEDKGFTVRFDLIREKGIPLSRTDVPETVRRVMQKCLSFEASQRYRGFEEILQAFKGLTTPAGPASRPAPDGGEFSDATMVVGARGSSASEQDFSDATITVGTQDKTEPLAAPARVQATMPMARRPASRVLGATARRKTSRDVSISDERELIATIQNEINGRVIPKGESFKISGENYRVTGNIIVQSNAVLRIENAKLFFKENTGIVVLGSIRAKNVLFSALEFTKRWNNLTIYSNPKAGVSSIEDCRFHFGGGISGKFLAEDFNITRPAINKIASYGGALFIAGGMERTLMVKRITCYKCFAYDGGALYLHKSRAPIEGSVFEGCSSKGSGGAVSAFESEAMLTGCTFSKCIAGKDGGGLHCLSSNISIVDSMFRSCLSKYNGGGIACTSSSPVLKNDKFELCTAAKVGGGVYGDGKSKPKISFPSFSKCKPDDTNIKN